MTDFEHDSKEKEDIIIESVEDSQDLEELNKKNEITSLLLKQAQKTKSFLEQIDLEKTESEMGILKDDYKCLVHRGPIKGDAYICPGCFTLYCVKCAKALKSKDEKCWSCNAEISFPEST